jgi:hypothetical protein
MNRFVLGMLFLYSIGYANAQNINQARFKLSEDGKSFHFIELELDNGMWIGIDSCTEIAYVENSFGMPLGEGDLELMGVRVKYYDHFDIHDPRDKLKSIGNIIFKYNNVFDIHDKPGTLKSLGNIEIKYYKVFDKHDPKGKVKSVGGVRISYYNIFDPAERLGDLKSIKGNSSSLWVTSPSAARFGRFNRY